MSESNESLLPGFCFFILVLTIIAIATIMLQVYHEPYVNEQINSMKDVSITVGQNNILYLVAPANMVSERYYVYTAPKRVSFAPLQLNTEAYVIRPGHTLELDLYDVNSIYLTWMDLTEIKSMGIMCAAKFTRSDNNRVFDYITYDIVGVV